MQVVFLEDVPDVAKAGEIKNVKDGYGRNFLLPRKLAAVVTPTVLKQLEEQQKALARKKERLEALAAGVAEQLNGLTVTINAKVGTQGRLYGAVTNAHIAEELQKVTEHSFDRRRVLLKDPIRHLGSYPVEVRLSSDVTATITVVVQEAPKS